MKIIFFGTPSFVLPILEKLNKKYNWTNHKELVGVVTQPPRPDYSAVDKFAHNHKISIYYDPKEIEEADLGIVASYGKIIPESVIKNFRFGILNIHPSLLPKYRGASPIQYSIKEGEEKTGVTIIKMDEKMDHGPIVSHFSEEIKPDDTNETLRNRLFERSADFLIELIPNYISGKVKSTPQDESKVTLTKIITKDDGYLDPKIISESLDGKAPEKVERLIRAYDPWPSVWSYINGKKIKLLKSHIEDKKLILDEVQLEGKNKVTWKQFQEGHPNFSF